MDRISLESSTTVYAKWVKDSCAGGKDCPAYGFKDLDLSLWYHDGIHFCVESGIMNGMSATEFNPDGTTTRAMIVTALWRMIGSPVVESTCNFKDVPANAWYAKAIAWAEENNIVNGISATEFDPETPITREQLATIFYRFAAYKGIFSTVRADLSGYSDADQIHSWAEKGMQWAVGTGLVNGKTATTLDPTGNARRCEIATMIYRFCQKIG